MFTLPSRSGIAKTLPQFLTPVAPIPTSPQLFHPSADVPPTPTPIPNGETFSGSTEIGEVLRGDWRQSGRQLPTVQGYSGAPAVSGATVPDVSGWGLPAAAAGGSERSTSEGVRVASLGGLIKAGVGFIAHQIPGVSQVYDGLSLLKQGINSKNPVAVAINKPFPGMPPLPMPSAIGSSGGTIPTLPKLSGGGGFGDVRSGHSSTARSGRRRYRRMNPMNVRALRRAARRLESGEKLFRKVFTMTHHKPAGSVRFKKKRRAS